MKKIKTTNGYTFTIDNEDYEKVIKYKWLCNDTKLNYLVIQRTDYNKKYKNKTRSKTIKLSRYLLKVRSTKITVDHIDNNPLNNQKYNLRKCTQRQNSLNQIKHIKTSSLYKGVHRLQDRKNGNKRYRSRITNKKGIRVCLGIFNNQKSAALAYNKAAKMYHGKYAKLNAL